MAYSDTSDEEDVDLNNPNLDAALHQAEQLLGIPPDEARSACSCSGRADVTSLTANIVAYSPETVNHAGHYMRTATQREIGR